MSINKVIRLGKRSTESDAKPRPVKLKLASEEQKHKLLKQTKKNWTKYKEGAFENVFIVTTIVYPGHLRSWSMRQFFRIGPRIDSHKGNFF